MHLTLHRAPIPIPFSRDQPPSRPDGGTVPIAEEPPAGWGAMAQGRRGTVLNHREGQSAEQGRCRRVAVEMARRAKSPTNKKAAGAVDGRAAGRLTRLIGDGDYGGKEKHIEKGAGADEPELSQPRADQTKARAGEGIQRSKRDRNCR
jgi:hypothetical protein